MRNRCVLSPVLRCLIVALCAIAPFELMAAPGDVDLGFDPNVEGGGVLAIAVQPDGKIVVGGAFTTISSVARTRLARIGADGVLDAAFTPSADGAVWCAAIQANGGILIGGDFQNVNGTPRRHLARLLPDGSLDPTFNPSPTDTVFSLAITPDEKILAAGEFVGIGGAQRWRVARLFAEGTLDTSFANAQVATIGSGNPPCIVYALGLQSDGKLVIGGFFNRVTGNLRNCIARLDANGVIDPGYNPNAAGTVFSASIQPDGRAVVAGSFATIGGVTRNKVARLDTGGAVEPGFNPNVDEGFNNGVFSSTLQTDGKIMIHGDFIYVGPDVRAKSARLLSGGAADPVWAPNTEATPIPMAIQADGRFLMGGFFAFVNGVDRNRLARIENDPATQSLTIPSATRIQWLRGGSSPEAQSVSFELSEDFGQTWAPLGTGTRIAGGWEKTGVALPSGGRIRARARTATGGYACAGLVETITPFAFTPPPTVTTQPASNVTSSTAMVKAIVDPNGGSVRAYFEYGLTTGYGQQTPPETELGDGDRPVDVALANLLPNRTYHFRAVATNGLAPINGADATFTTPRGAQTINFAPLPTRTVGDAAFTLAGTASSGQTVGFTVIEGQERVQLVGSSLTVRADATAGFVSVRASAGQTADFFAATPVVRTFYVFIGNAIFEELAGALPSTAQDVSNGRFVVVGSVNVGPGEQPARWRDAVEFPIFDLPGGAGVGMAMAITGDGKFTAGLSDSSASFNEAVRAGEDGSLLPLKPGSRSSALALTPDGLVVVGSEQIGSTLQVIRWDVAAGTMIDLGDLGGTADTGAAAAASADGSVVVGFSRNPEDRAEAFRWTAQTGMVGLGAIDNVGGNSESFARAISADGEVIVGSATSQGVPRAFKKVGSAQMVALEILPGAGPSKATAISADGRRIVGDSRLGAGSEAVVWDEGATVRTLRDVLVNDYGVANAFAGWTQLEANGVSPDGYAIVGNGLTAQGNFRAWRVILPRRATLGWSASSVSVNEGAGSVTLTIAKSAGLGAEVTFTINAGTAVRVVDGVGDYAPGSVSGTVRLDTTETARTLVIPINDDLAVEGTEAFSLTLSSATNGATIAGGMVTVTILDNDVAAPGQPVALAPGAAPMGLASLQVNLTPAGARWRLQGEAAWRRGSAHPQFSAAVDNAGGLAVDSEYVIEFEPVNGAAPGPQIIRVANAGLNQATLAYPATAAEQGALAVVIEPAAVAESAVDEQRGEWRFLGESAWRRSGRGAGGAITAVPVAAGSYVVEFKSVPGRTRVPNRAIVVNANGTVTLTAFYENVAQVAGALPTVLDLAAATSVEPNLFAGQVQSDLGDGSGFVVQERVVLTAAHVVFDDTKLSFSSGPISDAQLGDFAATGVRWRFQRMRGQFEPVPISARGSYVLRGYAGSRQGISPGQGTQQSQENDVAALYFNVPAARGGFGGFLTSDAATEWPLAARRKTFVSYPTDADHVPEPNRGRMHATTPEQLPFTKPYGSASDVYRTTAIAGVAGSSGGALCVQWDDGRYYAAGVYIGGSGEAIFRGIDGDVAEIIRRADESSRGGPNNNNGGFIQISNGTSVSSFTIAPLRVHLRGPNGTPAPAGAQWRIDARGLQSSGEVEVLTRGGYTLTFTEVPGFIRPANVSVNIQSDEPLTITRVYRPMVIASFGGLIRGTPPTIAGVGSIKVALLRQNGFSLRLLLGGRVAVLRGVFGVGGIFNGTLPQGLGALRLELGEDGENVTGTITNGATVLEIAAAREVFTGANPSPAAGRFTLALPRDPTATDPLAQPYGHGYATLILDRRGNVRAVGRLGDGSPFSAGGRFTGDEAWALFARPYRGKGALLGTIAFHESATDFLDGTLAWLKPATTRGLYRAAFHGSIEAIGSRYSRPARGASPFALPAGSPFTLDGGGLAAPVEKDAELNALRFALTPDQPNRTVLSIDAASGLLRGDFRDAGGRKVRLHGVVLPAQRAARGHFLGTESTGALELDPEP